MVQEALNRLFSRDANLIDGQGSEWAIAHRFAVYLEELLPGWNIDCEFNRQGDADSPKSAADGSLIRPDVVIHHRGRVEREHNLLAIELKKHQSDRDCEKVCEYTRSPAGKRRFQYQNGLTITLGKNCTMIWFENGKSVSNKA